MKKLFIAIIVLTAYTSQSAHCQLKLAPLALSGISTIHSYKLPPIAKFRVVKTSGANGVGTNGTCTGSCSTILPVTLLQLTGFRLNTNEVLLNWKTQNETNSKSFSIERSLDNAVTFTTVGTMPPDTSAATEKNYKETDINSYAATSFYRIKQLDFDGNFTYSNTIEVNGYNQQRKVSITPNPAKTYAALTCFASSYGKSTVHIFSANGQKLNEIPWTLAAGGNTLHISLATYSAGFYYVQLSFPDGNISVMKLVVR